MDNRTDSTPPPTFLQHLVDFTCTEGEEVELITRIRGAEEVVWVKNDQIIENSLYFKYIHDPPQEVYKLVIRDVFLQDSGLYICEAYNQAGGGITFCRLTVTEAATVVAAKSSGRSGRLMLLATCEKIEGQVKRARMDTDILSLPGDLNQTTQLLSTYVLPEVSGSTESVTGSVGIGNSIKNSNGEMEEKSNSSNSNITAIGSSQCEEKSVENSTAQVQETIPDTKVNIVEVQKPFSKLDLEKSLDPSEVTSYIKVSGNLEEPMDDISHDSRDTPHTLLVENYAKLTIDGIIDEAELKVMLTNMDTMKPRVTLSDKTHEIYNQSPLDNKNCYRSDDPRHDSGIIAGIEGSEIEKLVDDEKYSEVRPMSTSTTNKTTTSSLLEYRESLFSSLRDDSLSKIPSVMGPSYLIAMKDEFVFIRIKYSSVPAAKVQWTKDGKMCGNIVENSELSCVRIEKVSYDDSGRYVAKISNDHGTIIHHCFLSVEGPPEPPSTPPMSIYNDSAGTISISWSGSPYDGGSIITGYVVQSCIDETEDWSDLCFVNRLTYSFVTPTPGTSYKFRVQCQNMYGIGSPSESSVMISIPGLPEHIEKISDQLEIEEIDVQIRHGYLQEYYVKGDELGKGRFGVVFSAKNKDTGLEFAGKIVRCIKAADKAKVRQEVEIMNILRHPKLLQVKDALESDKEICIITEKINGGELFERVVADDFTLTEFDCVGFMRQICDGVKFMHLKNVLHLDLKPENILCLTRTTYNIKIIDFGLSQKYDSSVPLRVLFGTPEFIAPEIINYEPIGPASDMWAVGVITYVLLSGLSPFMGESDSETFSNITQGLYDFDDESFDHISEDAKDFISNLLIRRQDKRLTATECLAHKWLAYPEPTKNTVIATDRLKRFIIRRKWQRTGNAIRALGRMTHLSRKTGGSVELNASGSRKSEDSGVFVNINTRAGSLSLDEETEDEILQNERKRQILQRQQRVDSTTI